MGCLRVVHEGAGLIGFDERERAQRRAVGQSSKPSDQKISSECYSEEVFAEAPLQNVTTGRRLEQRTAILKW